jgi:hypothetical protein
MTQRMEYNWLKNWKDVKGSYGDLFHNFDLGVEENGVLN